MKARFLRSIAGQQISRVSVFVLIALILLFVLAACISRAIIGETVNHQEILVFAASSLTDAFTEIVADYEAARPNTRIVLNFASSSQLAAQLRERVGADVYASANNRQMELMIDEGLIASSSVVSFASNRLTVIVPVENSAGIHTLTDLGNPGVGLVLAVEGVPVRDYADQLIENLPEELQVSIYANLVSEESNVRQVVAKVALGEADAGIAYQSDITPDIAGRVIVIDFPEEMNVVASFPIGITTSSNNPAAADDFVQFVLSDHGQRILQKWGFGPASSEKSEQLE